MAQSKALVSPQPQIWVSCTTLHRELAECHGSIQSSGHVHPQKPEHPRQHSTFGSIPGSPWALGHAHTAWILSGWAACGIHRHLMLCGNGIVWWQCCMESCIMPEGQHNFCRMPIRAPNSHAAWDILRDWDAPIGLGTVCDGSHSNGTGPAPMTMDAVNFKFL